MLHILGKHTFMLYGCMYTKVPLVSEMPGQNVFCFLEKPWLPRVTDYLPPAKELPEARRHSRITCIQKLCHPADLPYCCGHGFRGLTPSSVNTILVSCYWQMSLYCHQDTNSDKAVMLLGIELQQEQQDSDN